MKFKVGDRVICSEKSNRFYNLEGTISEARLYDHYPYTIRWDRESSPGDNGGVWSDYYLIEAEQPIDEIAEFFS